MADKTGSKLKGNPNYNILGPVFAPIEKIQELIEHRHQREIQMLELITSGKDSMDDIFNAIYKDIHPGLHNTARRQIQAHINKLVKEKRIEQTGNIYRIVQ